MQAKPGIVFCHGMIIKSGTPSETPLSAPNVREKLSGSAAALFQRFGYAHVSIRDITSSIDIPKGTFYNHFKKQGGSRLGHPLPAF